MRILIVDDDEIASYILRKILQNLNHEVDKVHSCGLVEELIMKEHFDLIITDWMLPVMTGLELIIRLKTAPYPTPPVILSSSMYEDLLEKEATRVGAEGFLSKPYMQHKVEETIQLVLKNLGRNTIEGDWKI